MRQIHTLFKFVSIGLLAALLTGSSAQAQTPGETLFRTHCVSCHSIGDGKIVGPDLAGISDRRTEDWILSFVKDSTALIASGDADAKAVFDEFKIPMESFSAKLSDEEIKSIVAYIATGGTSAPTPYDTATAEHFALGEKLFTGEARFENGGTSCQSCHQVSGVGILGGGSLAKDLTRSGDRIKGAGIQGTIQSPSYPMMALAYADKPLTTDEVFALTAFLEKQSKDNVAEGGGMAGIGFLVSGLLGCAALIGIYSLLWKGRKRGCVYDEIHARQLKSE